MRRLIADNIATIVVGVVVAALVAAVLLLARPTGTGEARYVVVHDSEGTTQVLDLSQDTTLEIESTLGRNVVVVEGGRAQMAEADCPSGTCLREKPISEVGQQIICMPHRVWLEVTDTPTTSGTRDVECVDWDDSASDVDLLSR